MPTALAIALSLLGILIAGLGLLGVWVQIATTAQDRRERSETFQQ